MIPTARTGSSGPLSSRAWRSWPLNQPHGHIQAALDLAELIDRDHVWFVEPGC